MKLKWILIILLPIGLYFSGRGILIRYQADIAELELAVMRSEALQYRNAWRIWKSEPAAHRMPFEEWSQILQPPDKNWFLRQTVHGDFFCGTFGADGKPGTKDDQVFFWKQLAAPAAEEAK